MSIVSVKYQNNLEHEAKINDHTVIFDEPKDLGGDNKGASPYNILLAALGACTSITMLMYARKHGWELNDVEIELQHERIHAEDCKTCETRTGKLDKIIKNIKIKGNLNEEQKNRLLEIAGKCPVHRTLTHENLIIDKIELLP